MQRLACLRRLVPIGELMNALQQGFTLISFDEQPEAAAPLNCLRPVTAALLAGYRLADTAGGTVPNLEHVYLVPRHPRVMRDMPRSRARRVITFRFVSGSRRTLAGELRVEEFIAALEADAALRARFSALADWDRSLAIMDGKIRAVPLAVRAGYDDRRFVIVPLIESGATARLRSRVLEKFEG